MQIELLHTFLQIYSNLPNKQ